MVTSVPYIRNHCVSSFCSMFCAGGAILRRDTFDTPQARCTQWNWSDMRNPIFFWAPQDLGCVSRFIYRENLLT